MNVESILRVFAKHLRREEYGSAAQLANNELGDGQYENVEHIAEALDRWETGSRSLAERTFCFRSVYRSMLFEDSLRCAVGHFIGERSLPLTRASTADILASIGRFAPDPQGPRMRFCVWLSVVLAVWPSASAGAPASLPNEVNAAIDRGLVFLAKDARAWREAHHCASCHHASLTVRAMREADRKGRTVDRALLAELAKWQAEAGDGKTSVPRPAGVPKALNTKALYFALGLESNSAPDPTSQKGLDRLLSTVKSDQVDDGSWAAWPDTRPPFFGNSNESMTVLAALTLVPAAASGDRSAKEKLDRAVDWLARTKSDDDPQSVALRLILWRRLGRPSEEWQPLVKRIEQRQNADGGWSQAKDMASDAWATGQAVFALTLVAAPDTAQAIARAKTFLIKTQRADGSWPMTSRPTKPGGNGSTSLIPIIGAGSAWAVIGLAQGP